MIIKSTLKAVEDLVRDFKNKDVNDRLVSYSVILTLLNQIEECVKDQKYPNYAIYKGDLLKGCEVLCGLDEDNGIEEAQYIGAALASIRKMGSYTCFNVDNHYI